MSPSVVCYPQPGKPKSRRILEAFAAGCGGTVLEVSGAEQAPLVSNPAAFYGVVGIERLFRSVRQGGDWYYVDNAYFDRARGTHFRIGKNALQARGGRPDWKRFAELTLGIQPWQRSGRHIVVCVQSDHFMREVCGWLGGANGWLTEALEVLRRYTDRDIVVRTWEQDKARAAATLHDDLRGAWALVTHMSAAANEALIAGIPVFVTGQCAALAMGLSQLEQIEHPRRPDGRHDWAAALAAQQWTLEEIEQGVAWRALNS